MVQYNLPDDTFEKFIKTVKAVTKAELESVAQKYIHPDKLVIAIVGDVAKIEPGIRELGIADVTQLDAEGNPIEK